MANFESKRYEIRKLMKHDFSVLFTLAEHHLPKENDFPWILGKSVNDCKRLAHAYALNQDLYPYAFVVMKDAKPVGCMVAQKLTAAQEIEVALVLDATNTAEDAVTLLKEFEEYATSEGYRVFISTHDKSVKELLEKEA